MEQTFSCVKMLLGIIPGFLTALTTGRVGFLALQTQSCDADDVCVSMVAEMSKGSQVTPQFSRERE